MASMNHRSSAKRRLRRRIFQSLSRRLLSTADDWRGRGSRSTRNSGNFCRQFRRADPGRNLHDAIRGTGFVPARRPGAHSRLRQMKSRGQFTNYDSRFTSLKVVIDKAGTPVFDVWFSLARKTKNHVKSRLQAGAPHVGEIAQRPSIMLATTFPVWASIDSVRWENFPANGIAMMSASAPLDNSPVFPASPSARAPLTVAICKISCGETDLSLVARARISAN